MLLPGEKPSKFSYRIFTLKSTLASKGQYVGEREFRAEHLNT